MKAYIATDKEGNVLGWAPTQALARAKKKDTGAKNWEEVEVPTSKPELIAFLERNLTKSVAEAANGACVVKF